MISATSVNFPYQKRSTKTKGKQFCIDCFTSALNTAYNFTNQTRQSKSEMQELLDLFHNKLNPKEVKRIVDPWDFGLTSLKESFKHYPIANSKIELLLGEETKRKFDDKAFVINAEAVSSKEEDIKDQFNKLILESIAEKNYSEEILAKKMEKLGRYSKMNYQDVREMRANHFLTWLYKEQNLKYKFVDTLRDLLIIGEEIACIDIISNEPIFRRCDPRTITTVRSGDSSMIEDADIIIEDVYLPMGKVIDMFYEELSSSDITYLEKKLSRGSNNDLISYDNTPGMTNPFVIDGVVNNSNGTVSPIDIDISTYINNQNLTAYDEYGNIRVVRVTWNSLRKIGELKWKDENGDFQSRIVDENYVPDEMGGENIEWFWVNEWWETTRLAENIYVKYGPRPVQFRHRNNHSRCSSGYVGTIVPVSLFKRMMPYSYLYDTFMYRTEVAFAKAKGVIGKLDISRMPDDWNFDQWMYYAEVFNWVIEDPFTEGKKGAATGKLSGSMNQSNAILDMSLGNYIQQHFLMLQFIEGQLDKISGISPQREGAINNRETVGGVERSVMQSSLITEPWFMIHDDFKRRVLETLFETAKYAYRDRKETLQYITDDLVTTLFEFDGEELNESEYGILIVNGQDFAKIQGLVEETAKFAMQNDRLNISTLIDIYMSESLGTMRAKLEQSEEQFQQRQQEQFDAEMEAQNRANDIQQEQIERNAQLEEDKLMLEDEMNIRDNQTKIDIALIGKQEDSEQSPTEDRATLEKVKQNWEKIQKDFELKKKQFDEQRKIKEKELLNKKKLDNAKLKETSRHNKALERKRTTV